MLDQDEFGHSSHFGRYELSERLAEGRTCDVFLATSHGVEGFRRTVIIKRIHPKLAADDDFVERYLYQVKRLFALSHANIVQVLDLDEFDGHYFLTEEYIEGYDLSTLRDMAAAGGLIFIAPLGLYIVAEVVKGVEYGHRRLDPGSLQPLQLCHSDLHPRNILVGFQGEVKVADFGIHRPLTEFDLSTDQGILRAYAYTSPEVANGAPPTQQSDAFALGLLTVEVCSGRHPYAARTAERVREKAMRGVVPEHYIKEVPTSFRDLIASALQVDPAERLVDMGILYDRIISYLHEEHDYAGARPLAAFVEDVADIELRTAVVYAGMIASEHSSTFPSDPGLTPVDSLQSTDIWTTAPRSRPATPERLQFTLPGADKEPLGANGREREIQWVLDEVAKLESEQCRSVFVSGPRGIGKSHLMRVTQQTLSQQDISAILVAPNTDAVARPYGVILDILASALLDRPLLWTEDPETHLAQALQSAQLSTPIDRSNLCRIITLRNQGSVPELLALRQSVNRIFKAFIQTQGRQGPVVVLLDGADRADVLSLELLHSLLAANQPGPLLLVLASLNRGLLNEFGRAATETRRTSIVLSGLSDENTRRLMAHIAGSEPSDEMVADSEGLPQWAIELALDWKFGSGEPKKPVPLELFVGNIPPLQLGMLSLLALSEVSMPIEILARALRVEQQRVTSGCQALAALHLLTERPGDGWSLGLKSLAPACLTVVGKDAQNRARLRIAHLLADPHRGDNALTRPARVRLFSHAKVRESALRIGHAHTQCLVKYGFTDIALNFLDQMALLADRQILGAPREALNIRLQQAQLALSAFRLERSQRILGGLPSRAAELHDEEGLLIGMAQLARIAIRYGDRDRCEEIVGSLSTLVDDLSPLLGRAYAALALAEWYLYIGPLQRAEIFLEQAYRLFLRSPVQSRVVAEIRFDLAHLLLRREQVSKAFRLLNVVVNRTREDQVSLLRCRGVGELLDGRVQDAVEHLDEAMYQAELTDWSSACLAMAPELVQALIENREYQRAETRLEEFNTLAKQLNARTTQARLAHLGSFLAAARDGQGAQDPLRDLRDALHKAKQEGRLMDSLEIGWILWRADPSDAGSHAQETRRLAEQLGDLARANRLASPQL